MRRRGASLNAGAMTQIASRRPWSMPETVKHATDAE